MRYELSTAATGDAVDFPDVLTHCRVVDEAEYGYVHGLLDMATRWVERRIERQLLTATWKVYFDAFPSEIELRKLPVASVTSVQYVDLAGVTQTLSASSYQTDYAAPDRPGRIKPAYGQSWPSTRGSTYNAVTVTFKAGYGAAADVPETIRGALLLLVQHWYDRREPIITGTIVAMTPLSVDALLSAEDWGAYN